MHQPGNAPVGQPRIGHQQSPSSMFYVLQELHQVEHIFRAQAQERLAGRHRRHLQGIEQQFFAHHAHDGSIANNSDDSNQSENHDEVGNENAALPLKIGSDTQEVERLIDEISGTGVGQTQDVERTSVPGPETGQDQ